MAAADTLTFTLPAPRANRDEANILWYETRVIDSEARCVITGHDRDSRVETTRAEAIVTDNKVTTTLTGNGARVELAVTVERDAEGKGVGHLSLNGHDLGTLTSSDGFATRPQLSEPELKLLEQWGRIGDSIATMGDVIAATSVLYEWGSAACAVTLVGNVLLTGACFFAPSLVTCGAALLGWGTFLGRC